jgi:hypothetical protein
MCRSVILLAAVLLLAAPAAAQVDPHPDGIGLYFDEQASINCIDMGTGIVTVHLVLTNATAASGVAAWECRVDYPANLISAGTSLAGSCINLASEPDFAVGYVEPRPWAAINVLANLTFFVSNTSPADLFLRPIGHPSVPGQMVYVAPDDIGAKVPMIWSTGGPDVPVATINGGCAVPAEQDTWGGVKGLYR